MGSHFDFTSDEVPGAGQFMSDLLPTLWTLIERCPGLVRHFETWPTGADDPVRVAAAVGRFLKSIDGKQGSPPSLPCHENLDRIRAMWMAMKLHAIQQRLVQGKPVHPGNLLPFRRFDPGHCLGTGLKCYLLGQLRHEAASRGEPVNVRLATVLLRAARRAFTAPDSWTLDATQARAAALKAYALRDFGWIRTSHHISTPRTRDRRLLVLKFIASGDFVRTLSYYLFDFVDYRFYWSAHSTARLNGIVEFLLRYAANRDTPLPMLTEVKNAAA